MMVRIPNNEPVTYSCGRRAVAGPDGISFDVPVSEVSWGGKRYEVTGEDPKTGAAVAVDLVTGGRVLLLWEEGA